jgi:CIC family chloride channel protein
MTELLDHLTLRHQEVFPIVDHAGVLLGVLTKSDLAEAARTGRVLDGLLLAADLMSASEVVGPRDSLFEAIRRMGIRGVGALPVVDSETGVVVGIVQRGGILDAYERAVNGERGRALA